MAPFAQFVTCLSLFCIPSQLCCSWSKRVQHLPLRLALPGCGVCKGSRIEFGDWDVNSPNPSFPWSPSLRHNRINQITTNILTYLTRQLTNPKSLPLSPAVGFVPHLSSRKGQAAGDWRRYKPREFAFQSQFAHWLSYDFGTPAHSDLSPPFTNPCVDHSGYQSGYTSGIWLGKARALLQQMSL